MKRLAVLLSTALLGGSPALAQSAPTVKHLLAIDVRGDPPANVYIDLPNEAPQELAGKGRTFSGAVVGPAKLRTADLRASYPDGAETSLKIILVPQASTVPVTLFREPVSACIVGTVTPLEGPSFVVRNNLQAYFKARDLVQGRASTPCGKGMKKRVAQLWFDKSYALATQTRYIAFDYAAAEQLRRVDPSKKKDIDRDLRQIEGKRLQLEYGLQAWAKEQGEFALALEVNKDLQQAISTDAGVRAAAVLQSLSSQRLVADAAYLNTLHNDALAAAAATTRLPPL